MYLKCLWTCGANQPCTYEVLCYYAGVFFDKDNKCHINPESQFTPFSCFSGACGCRGVIMCVSECVWRSDLSWWRDVWRWKHLLSNSGGRIRLLPATQRKSLIRNTVTLWNSFTIQNIYFLFEHILRCNLILWSKAEFSASLLQSSLSRLAAGP